MTAKVLSKIIIIIFLFSVGLSFYNKETRAVNHSARSFFDIEYDINEKEEAFVTYNITLEKVDSQDYIKSYLIKLDYTDISNLIVLENGVGANFKKMIKSDGSWIEILLRSDLIFVNDKSAIEISFKTKQAMKNTGLVRSLYVSPIRPDEELIYANFTVKVPNSFGIPSYISNKNIRTDDGDEKTIYSYNDEELPSGLLLSYGNVQQAEFKLNYTLVNSSIGEKKVKVTLIPESAYQKVYYTYISSNPDKVLKDLDGNYVAEYILEPSETREVIIEGTIQMEGGNEDYSKYKLEDDELSQFLVEQNYWEYNDSRVDHTFREILQDTQTQEEKINKIYDYVVHTLNYSKEQLTNNSYDRLHLYEIFDNKDKVLCIDFADLFVALARRAGIPARVVVGYTLEKTGYNLPEDVLHAWAEYYHNNRWIMVDPTWESTSGGFDQFNNISLNRIILAYYGINSDSPPVVIPFVITDGEDISNAFSITPSSAMSVFDSSDDEILININMDKTAFYRELPIVVSVENKSERVFSIKSVLINGKNSEILSNRDETERYSQVVLPRQKDEIIVIWQPNEVTLLGGKESFEITLDGFSGSESFVYKEEIDINLPPSLLSCLFWIIALIIAFVVVKFSVLGKIVRIIRKIFSFASGFWFKIRTLRK